MITIYHNPRCKKSREGLAILEDSGQKFQTREYLSEPLTALELERLISKLQIAPIQLVRKNESIWKENYKDRDLSDRELLSVLAKHPKLMERPVVENGNKAVIGRPPSNIEKIL